MGKEKKEIGKLLELLNEYVEETDFGDNLDEYNEAEILDEETLEVNGKYHDIEYLYTKKFGFIKWLVENDKIDQREIEYKFQDALFELEEEEIVKEKSDFLIMLLSISDTPIDFLCDIIKN